MAIGGRKVEGVPQNPTIGQLYYDHVTSTMRKWDGKKWEYLNKKEGDNSDDFRLSTPNGN